MTEECWPALQLLAVTCRSAPLTRLWNFRSRWYLRLKFTLDKYRFQTKFSTGDWLTLRFTDAMIHWSWQFDGRWDALTPWFTNSWQFTKQKEKKTNRFGGINKNNNRMNAVGDFYLYRMRMSVYSSQEPFNSGNEQKSFYNVSVVLRWKMNRFWTRILDLLRSFSDWF